MSFRDALAAIEVEVKAEFGHLEAEAKAELEKLLGDAKDEAAKVEASVRADIQARLVPRLEQLKTDAAVAIETAGPMVQAEVVKVVDAAVTDLKKLAGLERLAGAGQT